MTTACLILVHFWFSVFVASCNMWSRQHAGSLHSFLPQWFGSLSGSNPNMGISLHANPLLPRQITPAFIFVSDNYISVRAGLQHWIPLHSWEMYCSVEEHIVPPSLSSSSVLGEKQREGLGKTVWEAWRGDSEISMEIKYSKCLTGLHNKDEELASKNKICVMISDVWLKIIILNVMDFSNSESPHKQIDLTKRNWKHV